MLTTLYQNKENILKKAQEIFSNSNSLIIKIGIELEFFLLQENLQSIEDKALVDNFIAELKQAIKKKFLLIYEIEKERGSSQIEIKSHYTNHLSLLAGEIHQVKEFIIAFAVLKKLVASFTAQPFDNDCGNAMQFNISLHDQNDEQDEIFLNYAIAGLLSKTNQMMIFLAPNLDDYKRFSFEINYNLFKQGKFAAPVNLSFGLDNRSCAIRLPNTNKGLRKQRLEYRVACANADVFLSIAAILMAVNGALQNKLEPSAAGFNRMYGNAFDPQYNLKKFCQNLDEAKIAFEKENILQPCLI
jgi:glutamine synthetase